MLCPLTMSFHLHEDNSKKAEVQDLEILVKVSKHVKVYRVVITCRMAFAFSRMAATLIFATGRGAASFLSILSVRRKLNDCNASNKNKRSITFYHIQTSITR